MIEIILYIFISNALVMFFYNYYYTYQRKQDAQHAAKEITRTQSSVGHNKVMKDDGIRQGRCEMANSIVREFDRREISGAVSYSYIGSRFNHDPFQDRVSTRGNCYFNSPISALLPVNSNNLLADSDNTPLFIANVAAIVIFTALLSTLYSRLKKPKPVTSHKSWEVPVFGYEGFENNETDLEKLLTSAAKKEISLEDYPESFQCRISLQMPRRPVHFSGEKTIYDLERIQEWLQLQTNNRKIPRTPNGNLLEKRVLERDRRLEAKIRRYIKQKITKDSDCLDQKEQTSANSQRPIFLLK